MEWYGARGLPSFLTVCLSLLPHRRYPNRQGGASALLPPQPEHSRLAKRRHNTSEHRPVSSRVASQHRDHQTNQETGAENGQSKRKFDINYIPHYRITPGASGSGTTIPRHDCPPMQRTQQELGVQHQEVSLQNPNRPLRQSPPNAAILCRIRVGR